MRVVPTLDRADTLKPAEILVTRFTDPGWTPVLGLVSGIVTEVGGLLSHAAVIGREYGIPAVLNVPGATQILKTGQRVEIDGSDGHGAHSRLGRRRASMKIVPVSDGNGLTEFIEFPWTIYAGDPMWVPPLREQVFCELSGASAFSRYGRNQLFVCEADGRIAGRIAALVNPRLVDRSGPRHRATRILRVRQRSRRSPPR